MRSDSGRKKGFYWVRYEGLPVVAEYIPKRLLLVRGGCCGYKNAHWHVPAVDGATDDIDICEMLPDYKPLQLPSVQ
jgi:hypothetical protein